MQIPIDKNTRAEAMWRIISKRVDFRGKRVVDLGCGTGDFLWRAHVAGAEFVYGVDNDISRCQIDSQFLRLFVSQIGVDEVSIERLRQLKYLKTYDIAMCFSVLPYLNDIPATLKWMAKNFQLCLIEAQYDPEPYNIGVLSDTGMAQLLLNNGFTDVEPLGFTTVKDRFDEHGNPTKRTIWMCK